MRGSLQTGTVQILHSSDPSSGARPLAATASPAGQISSDEAAPSKVDHASSPAACLVEQDTHSLVIKANEQQPGTKQGLAVARLQAKVAKDALKALGWLDQSRKAQTDTARDCICLPLTDEAINSWSVLQTPSHRPVNHPDSSSLAQPMVGSSSDCSEMEFSSRSNGSPLAGKGSVAAAKGNQGEHVARLLALMQAGLAVVGPMQAQVSSRHEGGPASRLKRAVSQLLQQQVTSLAF